MKRILTGVLAAALALSLCACGGTPAASSASSAAPAASSASSGGGLAGKQISVMTPYLSSVTTHQMADALQASLEGEGASVTVIDTANDFAALASRIEDVTAAQTDAIVLVSADPSQVENQLREAFDAGIPVFGCDSGYIDDDTGEYMESNDAGWDPDEEDYYDDYDPWSDPGDGWDDYAYDDEGWGDYFD